ncbi:hypothetical protein D4Z93_00575 [Clostridium fermenticellae]|uniref:Membrane-associated protein n=1 Tax=Clostridium fermenticellae TaxID=2068654 RepID=A0A386H0D3_9CLOT|nr:hypothetical protein [Clostridium fermenticellae]AYD39137.1 hypothetical protein D4Z93_00575 [Clostridium fermenticellae]
MKFIILDRKKIGVTVIIIGLMFILLGFERQFEDRLKFTVLLQNNINSFVEYNALNKTLNYELPKGWSTKEQKFSGGEIIYHNDFVSNDNKIYGYVQVWNSNKNLKAFLEESKKISSKQNLYEAYKLEPIIINNIKGYLVKYIILTSYDAEFNGYEYFLNQDGKFLRFSFFTKKDNFKEDMPIIFENIVKTLHCSN